LFGTLLVKRIYVRLNLYKVHQKIAGLSSLPYHQRLITLNLSSLEQRRIIADLVLCYKIVYNLVDVDFYMLFQFADSTNRHTRGHCKKLCKPLCNSAFIAGTYWHRVINVWNALPDTVVTAPSATSFKKRLRNVDINKYCIIFFFSASCSDDFQYLTVGDLVSFIKKSSRFP